MQIKKGSQRKIRCEPSISSDLESAQAENP